MRYGEDEGMFDLLLISLGLFVGVLVGLTGVGGGALLTPLLILIAGVRPAIALFWPLVPCPQGDVSHH